MGEGGVEEERSLNEDCPWIEGEEGAETASGIRKKLLWLLLSLVVNSDLGPELLQFKGEVDVI